MAVALACATQAPIHQIQLNGQAMGTSYVVKVVTDAQVGEDDWLGLHREIETTLDEVDGLMSTYKSDSEISRFNRAPAGEAFSFSRPTFEVLRLSQEISLATDGAFDVTIAPLVDAWGFGAADPLTDQPPSEQSLRELARSVGYQKLSLDTGNQTATKSQDGLRCDLSAIAKGYAVDLVAEVLDEHGYLNYLVEIGGEMRGKGHNQREQPWTIAIESPELQTRSPQRVSVLLLPALATSGDYRNFYEIDGVRYSHTIDPNTLRPVSHRTASVSIFETTTARADALATALLVLGHNDGLRWATKHQVAALFLVYNEDGSISETISPQWSALLGRGPLGKEPGMELLYPK